MNKWFDSALTLRLITAAILLPLVIGGIFYLPMFWFRLLSGAVIAYAAWEWTRLMGNKVWWRRLLFMGFIIALTLLEEYWQMHVIFAVAMFWWMMVCLWIAVFPAYVSHWHKPYILVILGVEVLLPCWLAIVVLRETFGPGVLLYALCLVWMVDSGGFIFGKRYGGAHMTPYVSPNKTWAGLYGSLLCAAGFALMCYTFLSVPMNVGLWLLVNLLTAGAAIIGDLLISMLKRIQNMKDTGTLLPGHGGLLDRIDSLTAAMPCFSLCLLMVAG